MILQTNRLASSSSSVPLGTSLLRANAVSNALSMVTLCPTDNASKALTAINEYSSQAIWMHRLLDGVSVGTLINDMQNSYAPMYFVFQNTTGTEKIGIGNYVVHQCRAPFTLKCFCKNKTKKIAESFEIAPQAKKTRRYANYISGEVTLAGMHPFKLIVNLILACRMQVRHLSQQKSKEV